MEKKLETPHLISTVKNFWELVWKESLTLSNPDKIHKSQLKGLLTITFGAFKICNQNCHFFVKNQRKTLDVLKVCYISIPKDFKKSGWFIVKIRQEVVNICLNPNWHELWKQEKCSSLAPPRGIFYKTQWACQGVKLTQLMSILTSK